MKKFTKYILDVLDEDFIGKRKFRGRGIGNALLCAGEYAMQKVLRDKPFPKDIIDLCNWWIKNNAGRT